MQIASVIPHGIISVFASAAGNRALGAAFFRAIAAFVVTERVDSGWGHEHTRSDVNDSGGAAAATPRRFAIFNRRRRILPADSPRRK